MAEKLKPCPFCGGRAILHSYDFALKNVVIWQVQCSKCGAMSWCYDRPSKSAEHWNRRAKNESTND